MRHLVLSAILASGLMLPALAQQPNQNFTTKPEFMFCVMGGSCLTETFNFLNWERVQAGLNKIFPLGDSPKANMKLDQIRTQSWAQEQRLDIAIGFCPPEPRNPKAALWDCNDVLVVSYIWDMPLTQILSEQRTIPASTSVSQVFSQALLGPDQRGGQVQMLYVSSSQKKGEALYWHEGQADRFIINLELLKKDLEPCGAAPVNGPAACMGAIKKLF